MATLTQEIKDFVLQEKLGFVATVCPDGTPNLSPKGTVTVWDDEHLIFADIHSPETVRNIQANPSIEINVVDVFIRKGYRFKGTAKVYGDGPIFEKAVSFYGEAATKYKIKNIVLIKVGRVLPVTSPVYDVGEPEEMVKQRWVDHWQSIHNKK